MLNFKRQSEWAKELGVHAITLRRAVQSGQLAVTRVGRLPFHSEQQVREWLERCTTTPRRGVR